MQAIARRRKPFSLQLPVTLISRFIVENALLPSSIVLSASAPSFEYMNRVHKIAEVLRLAARTGRVS